MEFNEILEVASYAGQIMLESGAEAYRVEETINRICLSLGVEVASSYATPTVIVTSVTYKGKIKSLVVRITNRSVDLQKIHKVNDLSRNINKENLDIYEIKKRLKKYEKKKDMIIRPLLFFQL